MTAWTKNGRDAVIMRVGPGRIQVSPNGLLQPVVYRNGATAPMRVDKDGAVWVDTQEGDQISVVYNDVDDVFLLALEKIAIEKKAKKRRRALKRKVRGW